jgi:hypothetical protein
MVRTHLSGKEIVYLDECFVGFKNEDSRSWSNRFGLITHSQMKSGSVGILGAFSGQKRLFKFIA